MNSNQSIYPERVRRIVDGLIERLTEHQAQFENRDDYQSCLLALALFIDEEIGLALSEAFSRRERHSEN